MKLFIPNISSTKIGGGWTFLSNFKKAIKEHTQIEIVDTLEASDILFSFAPTTIDQSTIDKAKALGKKFVLRIDGIPEDNRNRGAGTSKLINYSKQADLVIYQTKFIENTVGRILSMNGIKDSVVVYNGVDTSIFRPPGPSLPRNGHKNILHINYRKDNNKRVEEVIQMYRELWTYRQDVNLVLLGRYPTEWIDHKMGFFNGERVTRIAPTDNKEYIAMVMRSCDLFFYPSFADPSPNVVMEAMACGLPCIVNPHGGSAELLDDSYQYVINYLRGQDFTSLGSTVDAFLDNPNEYIKERNRDIAIERYPLSEMAKNYQNVFKGVLNG